MERIRIAKPRPQRMTRATSELPALIAPLGGGQPDEADLLSGVDACLTRIAEALAEAS